MGDFEILQWKICRTSAENAEMIIALHCEGVQVTVCVVQLHGAWYSEVCGPALWWTLTGAVLNPADGFADVADLPIHPLSRKGSIELSGCSFWPLVGHN